MGTTLSKLNRVKSSKLNIKDSINTDFDLITNDTPFKEYSPAIIDLINKYKSYIPIGTVEGKNRVNINDSIEINIKSFEIDGAYEQKTKILPDEYSQVEYIGVGENASAYIDTGVIGNGLSRIVIDAEITGQDTKFIFGSRSLDSPHRSFLVAVFSDHFRSDYNNIQDDIIVTSTDGRWLIDKNKNQIIIKKDEKTYETFSDFDMDFTTNYTIYLFGNNDGNGKAVFPISNTKIYSCDIYDNDKLVRRFIPCIRNEDNKPGLYDIVEGNFYENNGSGEFIYGEITQLPNPNYPSKIEVLKGTNEFNWGESIEDPNFNVNLIPNYNEITLNGITNKSGTLIHKYLGKFNAGNYTYIIKTNINDFNLSTGDFAFYIRNSEEIIKDNVLSNITGKNLINSEGYIIYNITLNYETDLYIQMFVNNNNIEFNECTFKMYFGKKINGNYIIPYQHIAIKQTGKNLLPNIDKVNSRFETGGTYYGIPYFVEVENNTNYVISNGNSSDNFQLREYDKNEQIVQTTQKIFGESFQVNEKTKYIKFRTEEIADNILEVNFMLEKANVKTEYVPYQEELYLINLKYNFVGILPSGIKDYIKSDEKKYWLEKHVGKLVLTGDENWKMITIAGNQFENTNDLLKANGSNSLLCTSFINDAEINKWVNLLDNYIMVHPNIFNIFRIRCDKYNTVDEFKQFLKEQYNNGTPVTIYYELLESEIVNLGEFDKTIKMFKETNNFELLANIESNIKFNYYKNYLKNKWG